MKRIINLILILASVFATLEAQRTSTGLIPLNDLKKGYYNSFQGGLYQNGENSRPAAHDSFGLLLAKQIKPLDLQGNIDTSKGKIVFLSIGMSNTTQEFSFFKTIADTDRTKNPKLVIVDGAQGGQTASIITNPTATFWSVIEQRLQGASLSNKQVQVCWLKEADANPTQQFPIHANTLRDELVIVVKNIKQKYPNCKIVYLSSRTYGGYATSSLNPEPYAYESGFSVKWLIEKQINGDTALTCSGNNSKAPWLSWGPYFWADGLSARSDGLIWELNDFVTDGTHPSMSGIEKVADALLNFLKADPTANRWFLNSTVTSVGDIQSSQLPTNFILYQNYPNPFNPSTKITFSVGPQNFVSLRVYDILGREVEILANEQKPAGTYTTTWQARNCPSGVYFYRLTAGSCSIIKKLILLR